jgi:hypothetical protein
MSRELPRKGKHLVPISSATRRSASHESTLAKYRAKSAAMVHKASGDPEEVCEEGLAVFDALASAREQANESAPAEDE